MSRLHLARGFHMLVLMEIIEGRVLDENIVRKPPESRDLSMSARRSRRSRISNILTPAVDRLGNHSSCYTGLYTFLAPRGSSISSPTVAIYSNQGSDHRLIWAKTTKGQAYDLKVQELSGEQYLTYWEGDDQLRGHGSGQWVVLNSSYDEHARIGAVDRKAADLHELIITPRNTALITVYAIREVATPDFMSDRSANGTIFIWDCLFQEIDLYDSSLVFQWRASDNYAINDTFHDPGSSGSAESPFDWFHINSVQKDELGNYIISARYTHSITYIDGATGETIWILGGKRNHFQDLSDGNAVNFAWQHDARMHNLAAFPRTMRDSIESAASSPGQQTKLLTLFDNAAEDVVRTRLYSRALLLELRYPLPSRSGRSTNQDRLPDPNALHSARLVQSYVHPTDLSSTSQGSVQVLPSSDPNSDPTLLVGYGYNAVLTTFAANGTVLCDARFAPASTWNTGQVQSYRAFQAAWVGRPRTDPVVVPDQGQGAVYVSWNGATEVEGWTVQRSLGRAMPHSPRTEDGRWDDVLRVPKAGFETRIPLQGRLPGSSLRVQATDRDGGVIGTSRALDIGGPPPAVVLPAMGDGVVLVVVHVLLPCLALLVVVGCLIRGTREAMRTGFA